MSGCAQCGLCCEAIGLDYTQAEIAGRIPFLDTMNENIDSFIFVASHWHEITSEEAEAINPRISQSSRRAFFTCDSYDPATKRCLAQECKPPICRDFPWYNRPPDPGSLTYFPQCSYWLDISPSDWLPDVIPLVPVTATQRAH